MHSNAKNKLSKGGGGRGVAEADHNNKQHTQSIVGAWGVAEKRAIKRSFTNFQTTRGMQKKREKTTQKNTSKKTRKKVKNHKMLE